MRRTLTADHRNAAAVRPKTAAGPLKASTAPASAGPANMPTLATVFITAFAAVSSSGVSTSEGRSAPSAGPKTVETIDAATASARTGQMELPAAAKAHIAPT